LHVNSFKNMSNEDNALEIPVTYKGEELSFPAKLLMTAYTYKVQVEVGGQLIIFEQDEERNFLAILDHNQLNTLKKVDVALLQAIATVIDSVIN